MPHPEATVVGIDQSDDGLVLTWDLGKTYRIIGKIATPEMSPTNSLDWMAEMGWPSRKGY